MLTSDRSMQRTEIQMHHAARFLSVVVLTLVLVVVSGCGQEKRVEEKPVSPPNASVDFNGPGNRVDATLRSVSPE